MITVNILSITSFKELLIKVLEWRKTYNDESYQNLQSKRIFFDTPYLKRPLQYDINILPKDEFMPYMYESLVFIKKNTCDNDPEKFSILEYEKFK